MVHILKLIIVDDDVETLQGISAILRWEDYGFVLSGTAYNARDALELVKSHKPDLIITDISMPGMDGLELVRLAKELVPEIKAIFLTCHESFDYAREAIDLNAEEYIVKITLTEDKLVKALNKVKSKIEKEQGEKKILGMMRSEILTNKYVLREKLFNNLLSNPELYSKTAFEKEEFLQIRLPRGQYRVIGLFIDNFGKSLSEGTIHDAGLLKFAVSNILDEVMEEIGDFAAFPYKENRFFVLFPEKTPDSLPRQKILDKVRTLQNNVMSILHIRLSACIGSSLSSLQELRNGVEEVEGLRDGYFYSGSGNIVLSPVQFSNGDIESLYGKYAEDLRNQLQSHNGRKALKLFDCLMDEIVKGLYPPRNVKHMLKRLLVDLESFSNRIGKELKVHHLEADTFEVYREQLKECIEELILYTDLQKNPQVRKEINDVVNYIEQNMDRHITCELMAELVNMNSSYFSRLFKNEMGVSFSDYLIGRRIERATQLLAETTLSIREIVKAVGLDNVSYFYRTYKKATGKTPGEVRDSSLLAGKIKDKPI